MPFLTTRNRGRRVYVVPSVQLPVPQSPVVFAARHGLLQFSAALAREVASTQCAVNCIDIGLTEEMVLTLTSYAGTTINQAFAKLKEAYPQALLSDTERLADGFIFLISGLSQGMSGQLISVQ